MNLELLHENFNRDRIPRGRGKTFTALVLAIQGIDFGIERAFYMIPQWNWTCWIVDMARDIALELEYEVIDIQRSLGTMVLRNEHGYMMRLSFITHIDATRGADDSVTTIFHDWG